MRTLNRVELTHFHLFCGLGGAAKGFNMGHARVGTLEGHWRCLGGVDVDPASVADFRTLVGVQATCLDLFDRTQYVAFHGTQPPADWHEATPEDIRRAAGGEYPDALVLSPPCKGFSGLLSSSKSKTTPYQALNRLTLRGMWLALEAFRDQPAKLVLLENVPRVATRGRALVDQIKALLLSFGYACAETTHDCGELGGLAQSRKRFLLVARHVEQVPPLLYEPAKRPLRRIGDVLGKMPMPGDPPSGPMHRMPSLAWKTWVRLAFVKAGSDWRSLNDLRIEDGYLRDYGLAPTRHAGSAIAEHAQGVADVRFSASAKWHDGQAYGVRRWDECTGTVAGQQSPGQGAYSVADGRIWPGSISQDCRAFSVVRLGMDVLGAAEKKSEVVLVEDPRSGMDQARRAYVSGGHYGVLPWRAYAGAVSGAASHDNGRWSVAEPRTPGPEDRVVAHIRSLDGSWHRPFTTLELAALQSLWDPEQPHLDAEQQAWSLRRQAASSSFSLGLSGSSDSAHRERIGNAIPPAAAASIASEMGRTLLLAHAGESFQLGHAPIWVRPLAMALAVAHT